MWQFPLKKTRTDRSRVHREVNRDHRLLQANSFQSCTMKSETTNDYLKVIDVVEDFPEEADWNMWESANDGNREWQTFSMTE